jgi:TonB family protein
MPPKIQRDEPCNKHHFIAEIPNQADLKPTIFTIVIAADGTTGDVMLVSSSGNQSLDDSALSCAAKWAWTPALQNGQPVAVKKTFQVIWNRKQ